MNLVVFLAIVAVILLIECLNGCDHDWRIVRSSDIVEFDDAGFPKVICLKHCDKCKMMKLEFVEVPPKFAIYEDMHKIVWRKAEDGFEIGGYHA